MDTYTLIEALRSALPYDYDWSLALYSSKKSRDGVELEFGKLEMDGIPSLVENTIINLLEKVLPEKTAAEYSPLLSPDVIGAARVDSELVHGALVDIFLSIKNGEKREPEDYASGIYPTPAGYIFYGEQKDEEGNLKNRIMFLKRSNPLMKSGKTRLCTSDMGVVKTAESPVLKFAPTADLLVIGEVCYFITQAAEKDLGLENRHFAICARRLALLGEKRLINNFEQLEQAAMSAKQVRKFADFDMQIVEYIERLPITEREDFLSTFGITLDREGLMASDDPEQCELIIDLLCCRSCLDALGRLSVGSNIIPR